MESLSFIKEWIIPFGSLFLAVWFASSAKKDAESAQDTLKQINGAVETWQTQIISSTVSIIDSTPQVVEGKIALAKAESAERIATSIQEMLSQLSSGNTQGLSVSESVKMFEALSAQLGTVLNSIDKSKT
jgi:hypothetical protein